jgi:hemolysin III
VNAEVKPLLRGVSHQVAFFVAIVGGCLLGAFAEGTRAITAASIYGAALTAMFGGSALYHRVNWRSPRWRTWARRLDHSTIFLFIAATYVPFALLVLHGSFAIAILVVVAAGAALGIAINLAWIDAPRWLTAVVYLSLGWVGIICVPQIVHRTGVTTLVLIGVGGALYTLGAVTYALRRPNPFPRVFGFHEVFHLLVVAAAGTQYAAVSLVVLR